MKNLFSPATTRSVALPPLRSAGRRTAVGRNDSSANVGFRAPNLQCRLSGDESDEAAVSSRPVADMPFPQRVARRSPLGPILDMANRLSPAPILISEEQTPDAPNGVAEVANQLLALAQMRRRSVDAGELEGFANLRTRRMHVSAADLRREHGRPATADARNFRPQAGWSEWGLEYQQRGVELACRSTRQG